MSEVCPPLRECLGLLNKADVLADLFDGLFLALIEDDLVLVSGGICDCRGIGGLSILIVCVPFLYFIK